MLSEESSDKIRAGIPEPRAEQDIQHHEDTKPLAMRRIPQQGYTAQSNRKKPSRSAACEHLFKADFLVELQHNQRHHNYIQHCGRHSQELDLAYGNNNRKNSAKDN